MENVNVEPNQVEVVEQTPTDEVSDSCLMVLLKP